MSLTTASETEVDNMTGVDNVTSPTNATSLDQQQFVATLARVAIVSYVFPIVIIVGTLGNLTSVMVLLRPRMRGKSVYLYLLLLAVADTVVLYVSAFRMWIREVAGLSLPSINNASCRLFPFLTLLSQHMAAWIVVLVTIDRFVAVWFPLKATSWCTVTRASIASAICTGLVVFYSGHVFWTYEISPITGRCRPTHVDGRMIPFMEEPFHHMRFVTYCLLPFVVILVLNVLIVARLRWTPHTLKPPAVYLVGLEASSVGMATAEGGASSTARTTTTSASASAAVLRQKQQSRVTHMLVVVSVAWLVLTTPFAINGLCASHYSSDARSKAIHVLVRTICFLLMYINHAINFVLYCLTGRKFRVELKEMVSSMCPRRAGRWVATSLSMRTTRSNCVEMEPLNNDAPRTTAAHHHSGTAAARRSFFVGDPANEVVVLSRDVNGDTIPSHGDRLVK